MKNTTALCLLALACSFIPGMKIAAANPELRMLGLAMHQETGRNIYLGAIHLGADVPNPENIFHAPVPKMMEYRIVARRTSIRSLLGNMLLQSEVATGTGPGPEVDVFAEHLLAAIKGSLYAGDSLAITQSPDDQITITVNGVLLTSGQDGGVFDYLLQGWLGDSGPSTLFRTTMLRTDLDGGLLSTYDAHLPTADRVALTHDWVTPETAAIEPVAALPVASLPITVESTPEVTASLTEQDSTALPIPIPIIVERGTDPSGEIQLAMLGTATDVQIFSSTEDPDVDTVLAEEFSVDSLDVTEYSHRLAGFNTALVKLVYSEIKYPRRAVRREIQGALELDITMQQDGSLVEVAIGQSSGHSILDGAAIKAAERAFSSSSLGIVDPVAVAEYGSGDNLVVPVPVNFVLQ